MLIRLSLFTALMVAGLVGGCAVPGASTANETKNQSLSLVGDWQVEYIAGRGVVDNSPARLQFTDEGKINGNASCNRFFGDYQQEAERLTIEPSLGVTKMMCIPSLNEQETRLLEVLPGVHKISIQHGILTLKDAAGDRVLRAAKVDSTEP